MQNALGVLTAMIWAIHMVIICVLLAIIFSIFVYGLWEATEPDCSIVEKGSVTNSEFPK